MRLVIFIMPVMQMIVFGVAVTNEVKNLGMTICDQDESISSRYLAEKLVGGGIFNLKKITRDCQEAERDLAMNRAGISVIIPHGFHGALASGDSSPLQVLLDGSDGNSTSIAMGYLQRIIYDADLGAMRSPIHLKYPPPSFGDVDLRVRVRYNPELKSSHFMIPGVITMILTALTILLTAMGITKEKENGTFEQLVVSPIRGYQLMIGKTIPYAIIGFFDAALITVLSRYLFGLPINGPVWVLMLVNLVYVFAMLGLGLFISTVSRTPQQAMMTVMGVILPLVILSDFFFPINNMPIYIKWITYINPMRYALVAQREIMLRGGGFFETSYEMSVLLLISVITIGYGVIRFRKSLTM